MTVCQEKLAVNGYKRILGYQIVTKFGGKVSMIIHDNPKFKSKLIFARMRAELYQNLR